MSKCAVFRADKYDDEILYAVVKKHFEAHGIAEDLSSASNVLIKPNLVADKEAAFSVTTNPRFVYAVIRCLKDFGVEKITVADCPGGSLLLFSQMADVYRRTGYSFLGEFASLNTDFDSSDVFGQADFANGKFNIINAVAHADYIINVAKLKTHNLTGITVGVKNLFGCIPGMQKPAFHAKYPSKADFSNMLVELAATVKPDFTLVDAVDIMEGNGPTNGKKRHLGVTFSSRDVFTLDKFIAEILDIPPEKVSTLSAAEKKGLIGTAEGVGDTDFTPQTPILLPDSVRAETAGGKIGAKINTLFTKLNDALFMSCPQMNEKCVLCKKCVATCPAGALSLQGEKIILNKNKCIGCLCCDEVCTNAAVDIKRRIKRKR
ncbi:MAG: DUF362 domain-containing protein [Clostridia bacterium]|nr:DUF362 domain-containing protein [Clostridia bacterium]